MEIVHTRKLVFISHGVFALLIGFSTCKIASEGMIRTERSSSVRYSSRNELFKASTDTRRDKKSTLDTADVLNSKYNLKVPDMVHQYGYEVETHIYTTEDLYINTLHRLIMKNKKTDHVKVGEIKDREVVFLQHGLLGTSADFVMGSPDQSLGYLLCDSGYDVWLGNARGNFYSRQHVNLTTDDSQYWKFSFDEMGKYDLPAAFKYIRNFIKTEDARKNVGLSTNKNDVTVGKLKYIGHSMGTTMFFVALNENPELVQDMVGSMIALAPVATLQYVKSPIKYLAPFSNEIELLFKLLGVNEFLPSNTLTNLFNEIVCDNSMRAVKVCENILFLLTGYDNVNMNTTLVPYVLGHEPGGTSTLTVIHFAQEIENYGRFQKFDFGKENMKIYNQENPPQYKTDIFQKIPIHIVYGKDDWLSTPKDVLRNFLPSLETSQSSIFSPSAKYNHVDFLWAKNVNPQIWPHIKHLLLL